MTKMRYIIANWKMHNLACELKDFFDALAPKKPDTKLIVAPPFTLLARAVVCAASRGVEIFAQNVHCAEQGAYTGEVSVSRVQ